MPQRQRPSPSRAGWGEDQARAAERPRRQAKAPIRAETADPPDRAKITPALETYERGGDRRRWQRGAALPQLGQTDLGTAKRLMRRLRDTVPDSTGEQMNLAAGSGAWMVEGSPARLIRDYNDLVGSYNRGIR